MRGPQRCPTSSHHRKKLGVIGKPEKTLELAGDVGAGAILDQRRRAHHTKRRSLALLAPGGEQWIENLRGNVALVERKPDLDRNSARCRRVGIVVLTQQVLDSEVPELMAVGVGGECKTAGRRQTGMRQGCEIGRLRPHPFGIGSKRVVKAEDEGGHRDCLSFRCRGRLAWPSCLGGYSSATRDPRVSPSARPGMTSAYA